MRKNNLNFKKMERMMGIKNKTNTDRINYQAKGKELSSDHYRRLMNQNEVYHHPKLPIVVVRTDYNRTLKIIDKVRMVELRVFQGEYLYVVCEGKAVTVHKLVAESYNNEIIKDKWNIHHINGNKNDNRPENLVPLPISLHKEIHKLEKRL